jgi:hypothetical protein
MAAMAGTAEVSISASYALFSGFESRRVAFAGADPFSSDADRPFLLRVAVRDNAVSAEGTETPSCSAEAAFLLPTPPSAIDAAAAKETTRPPAASGAAGKWEEEMKIKPKDTKHASSVCAKVPP